MSNPAEGTTDEKAPARGDTAAELRTVKEDLKALGADLKALCEAAAGGSKDSIEALKAKVTETAKRLRQQAEEKARKEVAEHPLTTLGITFLVGYFLGAFFRRR